MQSARAKFQTPLHLEDGRSDHGLDGLDSRYLDFERARCHWDRIWHVLQSQSIESRSAQFRSKA
jgi:hypothetical protein